MGWGQHGLWEWTWGAGGEVKKEGLSHLRVSVGWGMAALRSPLLPPPHPGLTAAVPSGSKGPKAGMAARVGGGDSTGSSPQPFWINSHGRFWWFVCQKYLITASVAGEERAHPALRGDRYLCGCKYPRKSMGDVKWISSIFTFNISL